MEYLSARRKEPSEFKERIGFSRREKMGMIVKKSLEVVSIFRKYVGMCVCFFGFSSHLNSWSGRRRGDEKGRRREKEVEQLSKCFGEVVLVSRSSGEEREMIWVREKE